MPSASFSWSTRRPDSTSQPPSGPEYWLRSIVALLASITTPLAFAVAATVSSSAPSPGAQSGTCAEDDELEENDDCMSAVPLAEGLHYGLHVSRTDADYFIVTVPAHGELTAVTRYVPGNGGLATKLFADASCSVLLDASSWFGVDRVEWINGSAAPTDVRILVEMAPQASPECNQYDLQIMLGPSACEAGVDDDLEDNEACVDAAPVETEVLMDRIVAVGDPDFYGFRLYPGGTAEFECRFDPVGSRVDLAIHESGVGCGFPSSASVATAGEIFSGIASLTLANTTEGVHEYFLVVSSPADPGNPQCNRYSLRSQMDGAVFGDVLCIGSAAASGDAVVCPCGNESAHEAQGGCLHGGGTGAGIATFGTDVWSRADLGLILLDGPPFQSALLMQGQSAIAVPFRDGVLCAGSPTRRLGVHFTNGSGVAKTDGSVVTAGGVPGPGAERIYQFWYRDPGGSPCGAGANLSSAIRVTFR